MWGYKITFKSISDTLSFQVESESKKLMEDFAYGMLDLLANIELQKIESHQRYSKSIQEKITKFLAKFKDVFPPSLNRVVAFFNRLQEDEDFFFLPEIELTTELHFQLHNYMVSFKTGEPHETLNLEVEKVFGNALKNYEIHPNGTIRKYIGSKDPSVRRCRFCGLDHKDTTFRQTAHAISEGLGNKKLFLYEECDACNERFSRELEPDIIGLFSVFRTLFDIKGKGGSKKLKGKSFEMAHDGQPTITFIGDTTVQAKIRTPREGQYTGYLPLHGQVCHQCYRCEILGSASGNNQMGQQRN